MPFYTITAAAQDGRTFSRTVNARDESSAVEELRKDGHVIIDIFEERGGESPGFQMKNFQFLTAISRVSNKNLILFFRMLSSLIASDVTITEALVILHEQEENRKLKAIIGDIREHIEGGIPLSEAFERHPSVFSGLVINMIRAGELGGILDVVLERISEYLESKAALKSKMIMSMIYPAVVLVVSIGVIIFLVAFVIPRFAGLLGGRKLPANTQLLLDMAGFLTDNALPLVAGFAGSIVGLIVLMMTEPSRRIIDRYKIYIPVIGPVIRYGVIVQFSRTFASLLESGISLVDALKSTGATITNLAVKEIIERMTGNVLAGEPLSTVVGETGFFTPMVKALTKIGEHSGLLDNSMVTIAELHERILEEKINRMSAMIEPALIISLGGIVGYVAWGLIAGMLAMYTG
ncbi:type II secretion system F family protein [Desulfoluna sp.]|uniref:type II secretion system F family protein n=1 Tax=Desulfoluna sp. TaxID=2045199 RepID=UPI00261E85F0|nr:type II secretion system F family protein [Desulfoluna sp.]